MPFSFKDCLVAKYSQNTDNDLKRLQTTEALKLGCCIGLSMLWAGRHQVQKNETPEDRVKYVTTDKGRIVAAQLAYEASPGAAGQVKEAPLWSSHGFTVGIYKAEQISSAQNGGTRQMTTAISDMLVDAGGKHRYASLAWRNAGGGHQMVFYHSGGKLGTGIGSHLYFFDPNNGEFKVSHGDTDEFFEQFWWSARADAKLAQINQVQWALLTPK